VSIRKWILTLQRQAVSSKYQLTIYQLTQRNIPADLKHHQHCCEKLRSHKIHLCLQRHTVTTQASCRLKTVTQKYEGQSNENLKSAIKIRTTAQLSCKFQQWHSWFESGQQAAVRYYIEEWSHCVPFVFNKLWDKTYLRFSFDSPLYIRANSFTGECVQRN